MYKRVLSKQSIQIAKCLGMIGYVHKKKKNFHATLDYYYQQLNMEEQCLPIDHPNLTDHLGWIVDTYKKMSELNKVLELGREKLNIQKNRLGDNHPSIAQTLIIMASILEDNDLDSALKCHQEALSVLENST